MRDGEPIRPWRPRNRRCCASKWELGFAEIYRQITASDKHAAIKETVIRQVEVVAAEAAKGEKADASKTEGWLQVVGSMMPDILEVTANTLLSPISGMATVMKKVAEKAKAAVGRS